MDSSDGDSSDEEEIDEEYNPYEQPDKYRILATQNEGIFLG